MSKLIDITGQRFGRLQVIKRAPNVNQRAVWLCRCDCGNLITALGYSLRSGHTNSCGCYQRAQMAKFNRENKTTHGACKGRSRTRLYRIWCSIKQRCYDSNCHNYCDYGERKITVCSEWINNFEAFKEWSLSHGYSDDLSIDRIDVNGEYSPQNCRWASTKQQNNNKRINIKFKLHGEEKTLAEWCEIYNKPYWFIWQRIKRNGMSLEEALRCPKKCSTGKGSYG